MASMLFIQHFRWIHTGEAATNENSNLDNHNYVWHNRIEVFEDNDKAIEWMRQPSPAFANTAPLDLMDTELGTQSVQQVLNAIATGGVV